MEEVFTGFSGADMSLYQDGVQLGEVRAIRIKSDHDLFVMFTSLDREEYRNDGTAAIEIVFSDDGENLCRRTVNGFKLMDYGSYDVNEALKYTCSEVIDG